VNVFSFILVVQKIFFCYSSKDLWLGAKRNSLILFFVFLCQKTISCSGTLRCKIQRLVGQQDGLPTAQPVAATDIGRRDVKKGDRTELIFNRVF
jgi:hypothetical protein